MYVYKLKIAYDGSGFSGWQVQPNAVTIQETIQNALFTLLQEKVSLIGSGRTDAGVHALAQVAHFKYGKRLDCRKLLASLNGLLPHAIRILEAVEAPSNFHAQYSAASKCYHYHLWLEQTHLPWKRPYSWHVRSNFCPKRLREGAGLFIGEHDFTTFANEAHSGSAAKNAVRRLTRLDVVEQEGGLRLEFESNGFLYKMVRNIVGTLHEVATGKREIAEISELFAAKDRRKAGKAAPAHGLFLVTVRYPQETLQNCGSEEPPAP